METPSSEQRPHAFVRPGAVADVLTAVARDPDLLDCDLALLDERADAFVLPDMSSAELRASYTRAAIELTSPEAPRWEFVAARLLAADFAAELEREQEERGLEGFVDKVHYLVGEGLYGSYIVEGYSDAELAEAAAFIDPSRDALFTYSGCFVAISSATARIGPSRARRRCFSVSRCTLR